MKKILLLLILTLASCSLEKVIQHQGVHNLDIKQKKLITNVSNKNEVIKIVGPPSTKGAFNNDIYIYIERKTSGSKLLKFGKKTLIKNNVLVLEIDNKGILVSKNFYNKDDMNKIEFENNITTINYSKRSFIYNVLSSMRQKIDDPLGKKRIKN